MTNPEPGGGLMNSEQTIWKRRKAVRAAACALAVLSLAQMNPSSTVASANDKNSPGASEGVTYPLIPAESRSLAPDFALTDIAGRKLSLSDYRGHVVLLDFWAVDCGGCVIEIPWYVEFDKKFRDLGLRLIGIDMYGESPAYIRPYMQKSGMEYPVAVGNDDIRKRFHAEELPKTMLVDRQGRIAVSHVGIVDKAAFERDIEELLK
jgi:peroxiredoxin